MHLSLLGQCLQAHDKWHNVGQYLEEDKRATTNVQNGLVFSFIL